MAQLPSTAQSRRASSAGGEVTTPCKSRGSSFTRAFRRLKRPAHESWGARPFRQTRRHFSMMKSPLRVRSLLCHCTYVHYNLSIVRRKKDEIFANWQINYVLLM